MAPKRGQPQNFDPLGSIFSFIQGQAAKPVKKKPLRISGYDSSDPLVSGFATLAGQAGNLVPDSVMTGPNEFLGGVELLKVNVDKKDAGDNNSPEVKVKSKDIVPLLWDPKAYLDKAFMTAEQQRQWGGTLGVAGGLGAAISGYWAYKQGLSTQDTIRFARAAQENPPDVVKEDGYKIFAENVALNAAANGNTGLKGDFKKAERAGQDLYTAMRGAAPKNMRNFMDLGVYVGDRQVFDDSMMEVLRQRYTANALDKKDDYALKYYNELLKGKSLNATQLAEANRIKKILDDRYREATSNWVKIENKLTAQGYSTDEIKSIRESFSDTYQQVTNFKLAPARIDFYNNGGISATGFRSLVGLNYELKSLDTSIDAKKRESLRKSANAIYIWDRHARLDVGAGVQISNDLVTALKAEITALSSDPANAAKVRELQAVLNRTERLQKVEYNRLRGLERFGRFGTKDQDYLNGYRSGVIDGANDFVSPLRKKREATLLQDAMKFEIYEFEKNAAASGRTLTAQEKMKIRDLKMRVASLNDLPTYDLGTYLGNLDAIKKSLGNISEGKLLMGVMSGSIFGGPMADPLLAPGMSTEVKLWGRDKSGNYFNFTNAQRTIDESNKFKYHDSTYVPKIILPRDDVLPAYRSLVNLYYLGPFSLAKTLTFNGEGFHYLSYRKQTDAIRSIAKAVQGDPALLAFLQGNPAFKGFLDKNGDLNTEALFLKAPQFVDLLAGTSYSGLAGALGRKTNMAMRYARLGRIFGTPERILTMFSRRLDPFKEKVNMQMIKALSFFSKDARWNEALQKFFSVNSTIGLRQLIKTGVTVFLEFIGASIAGPLGAALSFILTEIVERLAYAIAKPVLQFSTIALFGLIAIVCFLCQYMTSPIFTFQNSRTIVPEAGVEDISAVPDGPSTGLPGNFPQVPVPPSDGNSSCPINQGAFCAQGPNGSFSHARMGTLAIDVSTGAGIWRAPADGTVTESIPDMDCEWEANPVFRRGGQVKFVDNNGIEYKILHIDPYVGTGAVTKGTNIGVQSSRIISCLGIWTPNGCLGDLNSCWSGAHYHLEVRRSGGVFNSLQWYNKTDGLNCQIRGC